ncbi:MAG: hypothetical protein NXY57DRAFT_1005661 [Lentinula lateritia]|nr:MAG: hypothetical protein NXY57DRAFT_1005661 [Lentinula lateritia]
MRQLGICGVIYFLADASNMCSQGRSALRPQMRGTLELSRLKKGGLHTYAQLHMFQELQKISPLPVILLCNSQWVTLTCRMKCIIPKMYLPEAVEQFFSYTLLEIGIMISYGQNRWSIYDRSTSTFLVTVDLDCTGSDDAARSRFLTDQHLPAQYRREKHNV